MSAGIFLGSVFSYILQVVLGRLFTIDDYGVFNSLLSLSTILTIPIAAIITSLIKIVADLRVENDEQALSYLYWNISRKFLFSGLALTALTIAFKDFLLKYLNISNPNIIYPFAFLIAATLMSNIPTAYLLGLLRYKGFSLFTSIQSLLRVLLTAIVVYMGFKVAGAFYAMTFTAILAYLFGAVLLKKNLIKGATASLDSVYQKILTFSFAVLAIRAGLAFISSIDLILVKHYFDPTSAGIYAGTVTLGKIILFGTGIIGTVMFPIISDSYAKKENYHSKFLSFLLFQLVLVLGSIAVFSTFPRLITVTMFGLSYLPAVEYLPRFSLFMGLFSMLSFIYQYLLAIETTHAYKVLGIAAVAQIALISQFHNDLFNIIDMNNIATSIAILLSMFYLKKAKSNANLEVTKR